MQRSIRPEGARGAGEGLGPAARSKQADPGGSSWSRHSVASNAVKRPVRHCASYAATNGDVGHSRGDFCLQATSDRAPKAPGQSHRPPERAAFESQSATICSPFNWREYDAGARPCPSSVIRGYLDPREAKLFPEAAVFAADAPAAHRSQKLTDCVALK
jgi:hypothetical protein